MELKLMMMAALAGTPVDASIPGGASTAVVAPMTRPAEVEHLGLSPSRPADWSRGVPHQDHDLGKQSRPVYVWVEYKCPSSAVQVNGVHRYVTAYADQDGVVKRPAVVVLESDGKGWLKRTRIIEASNCCAATLAGGEVVTQAQKLALSAAPRGGG